MRRCAEGYSITLLLIKRNYKYMRYISTCFRYVCVCIYLYKYKRKKKNCQDIQIIVNTRWLRQENWLAGGKVWRGLSLYKRLCFLNLESYVSILYSNKWDVLNTLKTSFSKNNHRIITSCPNFSLWIYRKILKNMRIL